jgi:hypothetical protein
MMVLWPGTFLHATEKTEFEITGHITPKQHIKLLYHAREDRDMMWSAALRCGTSADTSQQCNYSQATEKVPSS